MKYLFEELTSAKYLQLQEDIDTTNSTDFEILVKEVITKPGLHLLLDFSLVKFIDSSGISVIAKNYRSLQEKGGRLIMIGCCESLKRIFQIIGFHRFFPMVATREEALATLAGGV
jgi:anti-anti-sigma factor